MGVKQTDHAHAPQPHQGKKAQHGGQNLYQPPQEVILDILEEANLGQPLGPFLRMHEVKDMVLPDEVEGGEIYHIRLNYESRINALG